MSCVLRAQHQQIISQKVKITILSVHVCSVYALFVLMKAHDCIYSG